MTDIHWEDPPPRKHGTRRWADLVPELKAHPGKWANLGPVRNPSGTSQHLRQTYGLQCSVRTTDGVTILWARWPDTP